MKAMTMKTVATMLVTLALTAVSSAQTTIYWTGNENRWGGGSLTPTADDNFSTTPGGTTYKKVSNGETYHHVYDQSVMAGPNITVSMNRATNTLASLTLYGNSPTSGFTFDTVTPNSLGMKLSGPVTVNGGTHVFNNAAGITLSNTANTVWDVASGASLLWKIPMAEMGATGLTISKLGGGSLAFTGAHTYTGNTAINAGAFGVYGGNASLAGNLSFASGADLLFSDTYTLTVAGNVTFGGFGIADLVGLDSSVAANTYTLINGNVDFTNIGNVGLANAADIGGGKVAYFQQGSLQLVVVPEPSIFSLAGLGIAGLLLFRHRGRSC